MSKVVRKLVYIMPYETDKDIRKASEKRRKLYEKYNSVVVYPNGIYSVRIEATDKIKKA